MAGNVKMGGSRRGRGGAIMSEINIIPLVDIVLVLLIIFMVTTTTIVRGAIEVKLPEVSTAEDVGKSLLAITIGEDGALALNGEKVSGEEIIDGIKAIVTKNPDVQAIISGDKNVPYGKVMEIIDLSRSLGVKKFAANVERKQ